MHHVTTLQDSSLMNSKIKLRLLVASLGAEDTLAGNPRCIPLIQFPLWPEKNNNLKQNSRPSSDILFHLVIRAQTRFKNISILQMILSSSVKPNKNVLQVIWWATYLYIVYNQHKKWWIYKIQIRRIIQIPVTTERFSEYVRRWHYSI